MTAPRPATATEWFRTPRIWEALRDHVAGRAEVTLFSGGCATGREPYSAAGVLSTAGVPSWSVIAGDTDLAALRVARSASYPVREVQDDGVTPDQAATLFDRIGDRYRVRSVLRRRVAFFPLDLGIDALPDCDVAMVRNCWRFLDDAGQQHLADQLDQHLAPHGWLIIGGADLFGPTLADMTPDALLERFRPTTVHELIWTRRDD